MAPALIPPAQRLVDVGRVRIGGGMERYFVCGLGLGLSACVTVESQQIRRLQGQLLYGLAVLKAMWRRWSYLDLTGTIDDQPSVRESHPFDQLVARPSGRRVRDGSRRHVWTMAGSTASMRGTSRGGKRFD